MTLEEMEEAGRRAESIRRLAEQLATARKNLDAINKHGPGKTWNPELEIKPRRDNWSNDAISLRVKIPFGVVQQSALDEVRRIEREIIKLGGMPA